MTDFNSNYEPKFKIKEKFKTNTDLIFEVEDIFKVSCQGEGKEVPVYLLDNNSVCYCELNDPYLIKIEKEN